MRARRNLLLLPGGLAAGHALEAAATGHAPGLSDGLVRTLLCVGAPLALWALLVAIDDGWRGQRRQSSVAALVAQQAIAFVVVDSVDHLLRGASLVELVSRPGFWASLLVHGLVGLVAWLGLRVATRVGRGIAAAARAGRTWPTAWPTWPVHMATRSFATLDLSSLSRRGPPVAAAAPLSA